MSVVLGSSWYPEQIPRERWAADAAMMREAGFRMARVGEFAWAFLEPEIGRFELDWLEEAVTVLATAGLQVVLAMPTAAPPAWLTHRLGDEILAMAGGRRLQPGSRGHCCPTSEAYQAHSRRVVEALAGRFGRHPAVAGWQIDGFRGTARCSCERCARHFRAFLAQRYSLLAALNQAWGTAVWSQRYTDWDEILPPVDLPDRPNPGHWLDWCRFSSYAAERFLTLQADTLRECAGDPRITCKFPAREDGLDLASVARQLDFAGYDSPGTGPAGSAFHLDRIRGLLRRPFWVLEQAAGNPGREGLNPALRPGQARLLALQAVARGADAVLYSQWQAAVAGAEQLRGSVLPHAGRPGRTFQELQALAGELAALPPLGFAEAPVAFLHGAEDQWADQARGDSRDILDLYRALWEMGLDVDVLPPRADFSGFRVVVAASCHLVDADLAARLEAYVGGGGLLLLAVRCGAKTGDGQVWHEGPPGPLSALCGARVLEIDAPGADHAQAIGFEDGAWFAAGGWRERLEVAEGTEVLARYLDDYLAGEPAIVSRLHGEGRVWYAGALGAGPELADHLLRCVVAEAGLVPAVLPSGIEIRTRPGTGGPLRFVLNHTPDMKAIGIDEDGVDLLTGVECSGILELPPYGAAVLAGARTEVLP